MIRRLRRKTREDGDYGRLKQKMQEKEKISVPRSLDQKTEEKRKKKKGTRKLGKVIPVIKARGARGDSHWLETGYNIVSCCCC